MKKIVLGIAIAASSFMIVDDILTKTGTNEAAIHKSILQASLSLPEEKAIPVYIGDGIGYSLAFNTTKAIVFNQREAIVKEMGTHFKTYLNSVEFKNDFATALKQYEPGASPKDSAYWKIQYDTAFKAASRAHDGLNSFSRTNTKTAVTAQGNKTNAALDKAMQMIKEHPEMIAASGMTQEEMLKKLQGAQSQAASGVVDANNKVDENLTDSKVDAAKGDAEKNYQQSLVDLKNQYENNLRNVPFERQQYNERLALYKKKSNYKANLRAGLQNFLSATEGVDFTAALQTDKRFVNPANEAKGKLWKACYRAGKEATGAARAFAQGWISELK